eukprot:COSAG02_NODE_6268_length_3693_cov_210.252643_4_plen_139_part_00
MEESWGGLFARAAMESGSFSQFDSAVPMGNAQQTFECIIAETNCASQGEVAAVGCLENKTTAELIRAQAAVDNTHGPSTCLIDPLPAYMFYPSIDLVEITDAPWVLLRDGNINQVDVLLGSNADDVVTSHINPPYATP